MGGIAILDLFQGIIGKVRSKGGQNRIKGPGALYFGMIIVLTGQRQEINQAVY